MTRFLILDAVATLAVLAVWYAWFARYNRRRGSAVLHWVQTACSGRARVLSTRWNGSTRLMAELRFPPHVFEHARVVVRLLPRPIPVNWVLSRWRKQKETLSFEADLDTVPRFSLEVHNYRWSGHHGKEAASAKNWLISRPGPIVLTSRTQWGKELNPVINALLASRERNFASIRFSPQSPHFSATLEIDALSDHPADAGFLKTLRELAAGSFTSRQ
jgi:hypothetical protein